MTSPPYAIRLLAAACAVFALAACGPSAKQAEAPATQPIRIVGSSTVLPLTNAVAASYASLEGAAQVEISESGTRAGFDEFCAGTADINGASRPIQSREMIACYRAGVRYVEAPVGFDGVTVIVHPSNPLNAITREQLQSVWEPEGQGIITTWRQADRAWPDRPLTLFGPGSASGTFEYFTHAILGEAGRSRTDYHASEHDDDIVNGVAADPNAMGYVGLAHYARNRERLKALAVGAGAAAVAPNAETVSSGAYTPLSRPIFIYVNAAALDRPEVLRFVGHYITNAAAAATEVGYVALPASAYDEYLERVRQRRVGSAFSGRDAIGVTIEEVITRPLVEPSS
jgi:phosphate transport system substrate-binding protein